MPKKLDLKDKLNTSHVSYLLRDYKLMCNISKNVRINKKLNAYRGDRPDKITRSKAAAYGHLDMGNLSFQYDTAEGYVNIF
jgi:hypothetical protein